jgi:hypothetical protein
MSQMGIRGAPQPARPRRAAAIVAERYKKEGAAGRRP